MKIRRNITKIASVILCAALLTVAMATSAFAAAPTESGMIDIAVSDTRSKPSATARSSSKAISTSLITG